MISTDFIYGHRFRDIATHDKKYIKTDYLDQHLASVKEPVSFICHNSCYSISTRPASGVNHTVSEVPETVKCIYSPNVDVKHEKIIPIPRGIENPGWHPERIYLLSSEMSKDIRKNRYLYINHNTMTNAPERCEPYEIFHAEPWATIQMRGDYEYYIRQINSHKFVLCPEGHGYDTYRAWETLYLGSIPIVKRRVFTEEFAKILPIVVVDNWKQITREFLEEKWNELSDKSRGALAFAWWRELIGGLRHS